MLGFTFGNLSVVMACEVSPAGGLDINMRPYLEHTEAHVEVLPLADLSVDLHVPLLQGDQNLVFLLRHVKQVLKEKRI